MTVADYAQDWLAAVGPTIRPSTFVELVQHPLSGSPAAHRWRF